MTQRSKLNKNIPALTGVRALAALLVFFFHWLFTHASHLPLAVRAPFEIGYVGVSIFFALSGFLITLRYVDRFRQGQIRYGRYMLKRVIRIFPLYLFVLIFFLFAFGRPANMMPQDARQTVILLTLTQALFPSTRLIGTTVGWTLTLEFLYYILAPFLFRWLHPDLNLRKMIERFFTISVLSLLLGWLLSQLPTNTWDTLAGEDFYTINHYSIFGNLPDFMIGMLAALLYLNDGWRSALRHRFRPLLICSLSGIYLTMLILATTDDALGSPLNRSLAFAISLFAAALFLGLSLDQAKVSFITKLFASRTAVYLGITSFALYLVQLTEPIQWLYWLFLGERLGITNQIWRAVWLYGVTIAISAVLYHLVEAPVHKWLSRKTNG